MIDKTKIETGVFRGWGICGRKMGPIARLLEQPQCLHCLHTPPHLVMDFILEDHFNSAFDH